MKTEHENKTDYSQVMSVTLQNQILLRQAHDVMIANKSKPDIAQMHLSEMRQVINSAKIKNKNPMQRTRDSLAAMVGVTSQIKKAAGLV